MYQRSPELKQWMWLGTADAVGKGSGTTISSLTFSERIDNTCTRRNISCALRLNNHVSVHFIDLINRNGVIMKSFLLSTLALACAPVLAQTTVTVSPMDMKGWVFFDDGAGTLCFTNNLCEMVSGPATPPAGSGSAHLKLVSGGDRPSLGNLIGQLAGKKFAEITTLSYSTYKTTPTVPADVLAIALQFSVDNDVTDLDFGFKGRLVFEPYHEPSLGPVVAGVWQTWNTLAGKWWLSGAGNPLRFPSSVCSQSAPCTVAQLLGYYPNIGILDVPGVPNTILKAGSGWASFDGNVDALKVGIGGTTTTYNFELGPTTKDGCKNGGWEGIFKNQGQCVSSFSNSK